MGSWDGCYDLMDASARVRILVLEALETISGAMKLFMNQNRAGACWYPVIVQGNIKAFSHTQVASRYGSCATLLLCLLDCEEVSSQFPFLHMVSVPGCLLHYMLISHTNKRETYQLFYGFFFLGKRFLSVIYILGNIY